MATALISGEFRIALATSTRSDSLSGVMILPAASTRSVISKQWRRFTSGLGFTQLMS